jgi:DNA-binding XRE family transcriptional regulator
MNKNEFVSKMKKHGDNQSDLAKYIGISVQRFNAKLNGTGGAEFTQGEIQKVKEKYNLTSEEVDAIFFA